MIGALRGTIIYRNDPFIIIDVNGVGYKVLVSASVLAKLEGIGTQVSLFIYTHVREDVLELYGFTEPEDLRLFEYLISVSGVGCRTALGVFSVGSRKEILQAIAAKNVEFFTAVSRLGKRNAQKIIIELQAKVGGIEDFDFSTDNTEQQEIISALRSFGYTTAEAQGALRALKGEGETIEQKIRMALKYLGK